MYSFTVHAMLRMRERLITAEELLAVIDSGRVYKIRDGNRMLYDPVSKCAVFLNPAKRTIITVFRLKKKQVKRWCSR